MSARNSPFWRLAPALFAASLVVSGASSAKDSSGARAFVLRLYAHYPVASHKPMFDPLGKAMPLVFDASLISLLHEDVKLAGDEVPALDGDPLCDCQDDGGMTFSLASVRATGPARATAVIIRGDPTATPPETLAITLDLIEAGGRWRVYDIHTKNTPSLRAFLAKANRERRR